MDLITLNGVPDLSTYEVSSGDLAFDYWTPQEEGEFKLLLYYGIEIRNVPDHADKDKTVNLPCAVFYEPTDNGEYRTIVNGSVRLRSTVEKLDRGTALKVTYRGKKLCRNGNNSDNWAVVLLKPKGDK